MKTKFPKASVCFLFMQMLIAPATAQEVKEYVTKTNAEKIKKEIQVLQAPITAGGFGDGHGKSPVLTDRTHVPDTFALVSFYINDVGTVREGPYSISSYWITPEGGNIVANQLEKQVMASLKESFQKQGVILLTPSEFLDTPQKQKYYYETFVPKVSKLAKFLSNIETKKCRHIRRGRPLPPL